MNESIKYIDVWMMDGKVHQYKFEKEMELWEFHERMFGADD